MKTVAPLFFMLLLVVGCARTAPKAASAGPPGQLSTPQDLAHNADIPLYPGATLPEGKSSVRSSAGETRYEVVMTTNDSVAKVNSYYAKALKLSAIPDTKSLMGRTPAGHFAKIDVTTSQGVTTIDAVSIAEDATPSAK